MFSMLPTVQAVNVTTYNPSMGVYPIKLQVGPKQAIKMLVSISMDERYRVDVCYIHNRPTYRS